MRASLLLLTLVVGTAGAVPASAAGDEPARLVDRLDSPSSHVRESARRELLEQERLPLDELRARLREGSTSARVAVARLLGERGATEAAEELVEAALAGDEELADASVRALVRAGDEAVELLRKRLTDEPSSVFVARRLELLVAQRKVETAVLSRWQRKMGSYAGQFSDLAELGWPVQPILLAMLLDVPLEDRFVVLPETDDPGERAAAEVGAVLAIRFSPRRGYRTFDPLPVEVEAEDLFRLAVLALGDVADVDVLGPILEDVARSLQAHDDSMGFRVRPFERYFAESIEQLLSQRGRHDLLDRRIQDLRRRERSARLWAGQRGGRRNGDSLSLWATTLRDLASALHRRRHYDAAAEAYQQAVDISVELTGEVPAIDGYNRACALACGGRIDEALEQLEAALETSTDDLPYEWVTEDGDLRSLHGEPEFDRILRRFYGTGLPPVDESD